MKKRKLFLVFGTATLGLASLISLTSCGDISKKIISFKSYNSTVSADDFYTNIKTGIKESLTKFSDNVTETRVTGKDLLTMPSYTYDSYEYKGYRYDDNNQYSEDARYEETTENHDDENKTWYFKNESARTLNSTKTTDTRKSTSEYIMQYDNGSDNYYYYLNLDTKSKERHKDYPEDTSSKTPVCVDYLRELSQPTNFLNFNFGDFEFIISLAKTEYFTDDKVYTSVSTVDGDLFSKYQSKNNNKIQNLEIDSKTQFYYDDSSLHILIETKINVATNDSKKLTVEYAKSIELKYERKAISPKNVDDFINSSYM